MYVLDGPFDEPGVVYVFPFFLDLDPSEFEPLEVSSVASVQVQILVVGYREVPRDLEAEWNAEDSVILNRRLECEEVDHLGPERYFLDNVPRLDSCHLLEINRGCIVLQKLTTNHVPERRISHDKTLVPHKLLYLRPARLYLKFSCAVNRNHLS